MARRMRNAPPFCDTGEGRDKLKRQIFHPCTPSSVGWIILRNYDFTKWYIVMPLQSDQAQPKSNAAL
jgi:hypothetical protein